MRDLRIFLQAFCLLLVISCSFALASGQSGSGSRSSSAPVTASGTIPLAPERRVVFISGRVLLEDGTAPKERVTIERVCRNRVFREGNTDRHGQFGFQLGSQLQAVQDAGSRVNDPMPMQRGTARDAQNQVQTAAGVTTFTVSELMTCELRASLPGFRSDTISLAGRQLFDNVDVGTIVLHRTGKVEGTSVSVVSLKAPKQAKKAFAQGLELANKKKLAEASAEFARAIQLYPQYAEAMLRLGQVYDAQGRRDEANRLFQQAIAADPKFVLPYLELAFAAVQTQQWKQALEMSDRALALDPYSYHPAYFYNALANYNLGNLDVAEKNARTARRLDSQYQNTQIDLLLANILLERRDYAGAAEQLRSFLQHEPAGPQADSVRKVLQETESKIASAPATPKQ